MVLWFQAVSGILALCACFLSLGGVPKPPEHLWFSLIGVGVWATIGQLLMTAAYQREKAAIVSTASYAGPVAAVIADIIAFGDFPSWNGYLGGGIVIAAGVLLLRSNQQTASSK